MLHLELRLVWNHQCTNEDGIYRIHLGLYGYETPAEKSVI